jgi:hypothetical protein
MSLSIIFKSAFSMIGGRLAARTIVASSLVRGSALIGSAIRFARRWCGDLSRQARASLKTIVLRIAGAPQLRKQPSGHWFFISRRAAQAVNQIDKSPGT